MRKIFLLIAALVCASTMNLFAEDTRTVVSECSFTGWNPSIINVGDNEADVEEALALTLKAPEGAPYYVLPTMLNLFKWDNATNQYEREPNDATVTAGVYVAIFQIRIDNSGNYYATGMEYGDHQYGYSHRFDTDGMITYINGRKTEIYSSLTISDEYSYYLAQTPVFYVGMDGFKEDHYLPGKFSINATGDSIQFAQGNLQYNKYEAWWQFAENQYDIIGGDNKYISDIDDAEHQVIDLFGWGTSGYNGKSPTMTSTTNTDYGDGATNDIAGTPYDWAATAAEDMSLDGDWRTLTVDEWNYILSTRPNAAQLKAKATVAGQTGLILLPDNWDLTALPLNTTDNAYTDNVLELDQWLAWEAQGAVFLPAAGYRAATTYTKQTNETDFGAYWSSSNAVFTEDNPNYGQGAMALFIDWSSVAGLASGRRSRGYSVRLAREVPKKAVISECTFTGFDPSVLTVGGRAYDEEEKLAKTLIPAENAPYYVDWSMVSLYQYQKAIGAFRKVENNETITEGLYHANFQIRIDNSGNDGDTTGYAEHLYGDLYRFDSTKVTTYVNGVEWSMRREPTIEEHYSIHYTDSKVFMVRDSQKENFVPGKFSVNAEGDQIQFTNGNLQYNPKNNLWQLAENQWDTIGAGNAKINEPKSGNWIDLFGWGTGDAPAKYSTDNADYATFTDWGPFAAEQIAKDSTWYTLNDAEWDYILTTRANANQLRGRIVVNGIRGLILLPDDWDLTAKPINSSNVFTDSISAEEWAEWENAGAVFLPCAGMRDETTVQFTATDGDYWTSSVNTSGNPIELSFNSSSLTTQYVMRAPLGYAVRLAKAVPPVVYHKVTLNGDIQCLTPGVDLNAVVEGTTLTLTVDYEQDCEDLEWSLVSSTYGAAAGDTIEIEVLDDVEVSTDALPKSRNFILLSVSTSELLPAPQHRAPQVFTGGSVSLTYTDYLLEEQTITSPGNADVDYFGCGGVEISATPAEGWEFDYFLINDTQTAENPVSIDAVKSDLVITGCFREVKEGIEDPTSDSSLKGRAHKFLRDGQLLIEKNGKTYNAQGAEVE